MEKEGDVSHREFDDEKRRAWRGLQTSRRLDNGLGRHSIKARPRRCTGGTHYGMREGGQLKKRYVGGGKG